MDSIKKNLTNIVVIIGLIGSIGCRFFTCDKSVFVWKDSK